MSYPQLYVYKRIVQAKAYIDAHFQEEIAVDQIAGEAYYSKFHFIRLFKKAYEHTPRQYLIYKRIEWAKSKLKENASITEACIDAGFTSLGSFSSLFKSRTGLSPISYKQAQQRKKQMIQQRPAQYIPGCFLTKSNFQEK